MPKFESDITSSNFGANQRPMRTFEVPNGGDENIFKNPHDMNEAELAEFEREVAEARRAKLTGKQKPTDEAKRRIEFLCGMFTLKKTLILNDVSFELRTLKGSEFKQVVDYASSKNEAGLTNILSVRDITLALSLVSIDGVSFDVMVGSSDINKKIAFLNELDQSLLLKLFAEQSDLSKESNDRFAVKTEEQAKELVEDLKK